MFLDRVKQSHSLRSPPLLRVGLTGGIASGKSAVALVFSELGAHVFSADELGRALTQPGEPVYRQIVEHFGAPVLAPDGRLDRRALAREAFEHGRIHELNAIVHPAVFRAQTEQLDRVAAIDPDGIAVIESALIFEVSRSAKVSDFSREAAQAAANWSSRFDKIVLVTAPDALKIARYLARTAPPGSDQPTRDRLTADARARIAAQLPDAEKIPHADYVIENTATLVLLRRRAQAVFAALRAGNPSPATTSADNQG